MSVVVRVYSPGMGIYVAVRGWLEFDPKRLPQVKQILAKYNQDGYAGGWAFPARPFRSTLYVFYGGDIRESGIALLRDQVVELARLAPADEDMDRPVGFFLLSDERRQSTSWTVRDGQLDEALVPAELRWFAERP